MIEKESDMELSSQEMERLNNNPLYQTIGILVDEAKEGKAHSHLRPNPAICWPFDGQPHGGILFTLMDTTMVVVAHTQASEPPHFSLEAILGSPNK